MVCFFNQKFYGEKGLLILESINTYGIFHHTVIETYFEMLNSSENKKLRRYSNYESSNFESCSKVRSANPPISYYY